MSAFYRLEEFEKTAQMYRETIATFARESPSFRGMMGMVNKETGKVMSIALAETEADLVAARDSEMNKKQVARYQHLVLSELQRDAFRVEIRYRPMNRPFPGQDVCFARVTNGWVRPKDVAKAIKLSRDSVVFGAISEKGCCGFFLCANHDTGQIMGFSMWDTMENLERSESDRGYYRREMSKHDHLRTGPYEREIFEVFARSGAEGHHTGG
jgi:hypothetical protein